MADCLQKALELVGTDNTATSIIYACISSFIAYNYTMPPKKTSKPKEPKVPKPKARVDYSDPLYIGNEMAAFDFKDYNYYDKLTDEQKKKFSPYLMLRWGACVEGGNDLAMYYAVATNENVNQNFWDLGKHKKLQWLCLCTVSPGIGKHRHYWLGAGKGKTSSPLRTYLIEHLPGVKVSDIDLILKLNSREVIEEWLQQQGLEPKELKKLLEK